MEDAVGDASPTSAGSPSLAPSSSSVASARHIHSHPPGPGQPSATDVSLARSVSAASPNAHTQQQQQPLDASEDVVMSDVDSQTDSSFSVGGGSSSTTTSTSTSQTPTSLSRVSAPSNGNSSSSSAENSDFMDDDVPSVSPTESDSSLARATPSVPHSRLEDCAPQCQLGVPDAHPIPSTTRSGPRAKQAPPSSHLTFAAASPRDALSSSMSLTGDSMYDVAHATHLLVSKRAHNDSSLGGDSTSSDSSRASVPSFSPSTSDGTSRSHRTSIGASISSAFSPSTEASSSNSSAPASKRFDVGASLHESAASAASFSRSSTSSSSSSSPLPPPCTESPSASATPHSFYGDELKDDPSVPVIAFNLECERHENPQGAFEKQGRLTAVTAHLTTSVCSLCVVTITVIVSFSFLFFSGDSFMRTFWDGIKP